TVSGLLALILAAGFLLAWFSGGPVLVRFAGRGVDAHAWGCLFLVGLALLVRAPGDLAWRKGSSALLALIAGGLGVATLAQYAIGVNVGVDQLLARSVHPVKGSSFSTRMSPAEALAFVQVAAALVLLPSRRRWL